MATSASTTTLSQKFQKQRTKGDFQRLGTGMDIAAFNVEERGRKIPLVVEHEEVKRVYRERASAGSNGKDGVRLVLHTEGDENEAEGDDEAVFVVFNAFGSKGELDSCLGLLEHLTSDKR